MASGLGFQGGAWGCFYRGGARALACGPKGNAAGRAGSSRTLSLSPARSGEGDAPDRRGPPGGETGREGMALGRIGPGAGKRAGGEEKNGAPVGPEQKKTGRREGKRKREEGEKESWAGLKAC